MLKEFREFLMRGNVLDLAVGIIIGAAFTTIVNSVVEDIISPLIGVLTGGIDFSEVVIPLTGEASINLGNFINAVINFLIVGFVLFMIVRVANRLTRQQEEEKAAEEAAPAEPTTDEKLLVAIEKLNTYLDRQQV
ncbi:large conductance mechanosensitive channel protein MscL [Phototrophicus methaneseepsis]|uniref:Large-conductance mechanosensitive channel n=1 Tax=Phototrophicus methaneseepsis TaxID=2710758 RepID=A0A7S8E8H5_9CHLR|nr:large conductance mechanosensitive channel protein MscL [Phototrophicus methaneseepsis]QPC82338.1 large conductance mechanosensitive channel protein MscL [Phototrophicus methaneseepsis]